MTLPKPEIVEINEETRRLLGRQMYDASHLIDKNINPLEDIYKKVYFFPQANAAEVQALTDDLNNQVSGVAVAKCLAVASFSISGTAPGQLIALRSVYGNDFETARSRFHPELPSLRDNPQS